MNIPPLRRAGMTCLLAVASLFAPSAAFAAPPDVVGRPEIMTTAHQDVLPRLGDLKGKPIDPSFQKPAKEKRRVPYEDPVDFAGDKVAQTSHQGKPGSGGGGGTPPPSLGMEGIGNGFTGPQGNFLIQYALPDTTGAVGASFVQWVNASFAILDKGSGLPVYGPVAGNTLFTGFGGAGDYRALGL